MAVGPGRSVKSPMRRTRRNRPRDLQRVRAGSVIRHLNRLIEAWRTNGYLATTPSIIPKLLKIAAAHGQIFEIERNVERIRRGQFDAGDRWLARWAAQELPEATSEQIDHALTLRVDSWTPDRIAKYLGVTFQTRHWLRLWSFGACDVSRKERHAKTKADKQRLDRDRARQRRRQRGAKPRAQYEAESLSRAEPWKAQGMTRRTWYRHGKPSQAQRLPPAQRGKRQGRSLSLPDQNSAA